MNTTWIHKMQPYLPSKYRFSYNYAFFLHDILAQLVIMGQKKKIFDVELSFKSSKELSEFNKLNLSGEDFWEWLEKNGYHYLQREYAKKHVFLAVLSDMCQYIFESIKCSQKGWQSVAFSLLRKPLKDNLFILEWLLADPDDFSDKFHNHKINELAIEKILKDRKLFIINESIQRCEVKFIRNAEFIYEARYSKESIFGYEPTWNKAVHLITNCHHYQTEPENINFVFAQDPDTQDSLWHHYYSILPMILTHAVEVCFAFVRTIGELELTSDKTLGFRKGVGFMLWAKDFWGQRMEPSEMKNIQSTLKQFNLSCPSCGKKFNWNKQNMNIFFSNSELLCKNCKAYFPISL